MNRRIVRPVLLIVTSLLSAMLVFNLPVAPVIPKANAAIPGSSSLLGFFSETKKSSAVIDSSIGAGQKVRFDINVTGAGQIKGFAVGFNWTNTALTYSNSSFQGVNCLAAQGCLFSGFPSGAISRLANQTTTTGTSSGYYLSIVDTCTTSCPPTVNGNGILFRIVFNVVAATVSTVVHFNTLVTTIENPGAVPYQFMDGYFDNRATALNYNIGVGTSSTTLIRTVTGTNTSLPITLSLTSFANTGTVNFGALGLPHFATPTFGVPSCSAACSTTVSITINGGPAGGPTTTPSGTYSIAIVGNSTATTPSGTFVIKETWLTLIVKPAKPPSFIFKASSTAFTQDAGGSNAFTLNATLVTGANDTVGEDTNCINAQVVCAISPSSGSFAVLNPTGHLSFFSTLNASTTPDVPTGVFTLNITATTAGTYSETSVSQTITLTITITRTHDLTILQEASSKTFSYAGVGLGSNGFKVNVTAVNIGKSTESFTVNATARPKLLGDPKLQYVDSDPNGVWDSGILASDPRIKFVDTNLNGVWDNNEVVVYDSNNNGVLNIGEPVVNGTRPANLTPVKSDPKIKFEDNNGNGVWDPGELVAYDTNNNGKYDSGEPSITRLAPLRETVIYNTNICHNIFTCTDNFTIGDIVINGTAPTVGTLLAADFNERFTDANFNSVWDSGEPVVYDSNGDGAYESFEPLIAGTAPSLGVLLGTASVTSLLPGDTVLSGTILNNTSIVTDSHIKFLDVNGNGVWDGGLEAVVYDSNANGHYDPPDPRVKFVDGNFNGVWDTGEVVVLDANNNNVFDTGDSAIAGTAPPIGTGLATDPKIRFIDANGNGLWDSGEAVIYDLNNNGVYNTGETVIAGKNPSVGSFLKGEPLIAGPSPPNGPTLSTDSKLKYNDANADATWDSNEAVVYSQNSLTKYYNGARRVTIIADPGAAIRGVYTIYGFTVPVPGEAFLSNNALGVVTFTQRLKGDVNFDCKVDIADLATVGSTFGKTTGSVGFNIAADLNNDGVINIVDLVLVAGSFNQHC